MPRITCAGKTNTLKENNELKMPLVVIYKKENGTTEYHGFIPGMTTKNYISKTKEDCKSGLNKLAKELVTQYVKTKTSFPFFPTKEEILNDFENVVDVTFIKIVSSK